MPHSALVYIRLNLLRVKIRQNDVTLPVNGTSVLLYRSTP